MGTAAYGIFYKGDCVSWGMIGYDMSFKGDCVSYGELDAEELLNLSPGADVEGEGPAIPS